MADDLQETERPNPRKVREGLVVSDIQKKLQSFR